MDTFRDHNTYTLRARAIEGSIPMPQGLGPECAGLTENNFELFCGYTTENLKRLFQISKDAYEHGQLTKFEILGWAGGAANEDGDRFLWSFRPDLYHFECIPDSLVAMFSIAEPRPLFGEQARRYNQLWRPMPFNLSLATYEAHTQGLPKKTSHNLKNSKQSGREGADSSLSANNKNTMRSDSSMPVTINDLINTIFENGVADSTTARELLQQALLRSAGRKLHADIVMRDLLSESAWPDTAQDRIRATLRTYEGQRLEALNPKEQQAEKRPLDQVIQSAQHKKQETESEKHALICLTGNDDRTWTAAATHLEQVKLTGATALIDDEAKKITVSGPDADNLFAGWNTELINYLYAGDRRERMDYEMHPTVGIQGKKVPFVQEQTYPVEVLYYRTDINGSGSFEKDICPNREALLSTLNWLGKCGFVPEQVWDFNVDKINDKRLFDIFQSGQQRRFEIAQREMDAMLDDSDAPTLEMPVKGAKIISKTYEQER